MEQREIKAKLRSNLLLIAISCFLFFIFTPCLYSNERASPKEVLLPQGTYIPFFLPQRKDQDPKKETPRLPVKVNSFWMETKPVTNIEFLDFVKNNPEWRKSQVARVFADPSYLKHWKADLKLKNKVDQNRPVTHVSWFAANAFCESKNKRLPTTDEWEYAADEPGDKAIQLKEQILKWYSLPNTPSLQAVGQGIVNHHGLHDLFGLVWEWTLDFNSILFGNESRNNGTKDDNLFCGAGSLGSLDASDYAKFMRYSFRASLQADYTTANLGFRCARDITTKKGDHP